MQAKTGDHEVVLQTHTRRRASSCEAPGPPRGSPGQQLWDTAKPQNHNPLNCPQIRQFVNKTIAGRAAVRQHLNTHGSRAPTVPGHPWFLSRHGSQSSSWKLPPGRQRGEQGGETRQQVSWFCEFLFVVCCFCIRAVFAFVFIRADKATHAHARTRGKTERLSADRN